MTDVYASRAELAVMLGNPSGVDDRLDLALIAASRWVDYKRGIATLLDADVAFPATLTVVPARAMVHAATLAAAVRFYQSPNVVWGVAGGLGDMAAFVRSTIPDVELLLLGQRVSFGVA